MPLLLSAQPVRLSLNPGLGEVSSIPVLCEVVVDPDLHSHDGGLDDATLAYILAIRPAFDGLRDAMGQLAGLMILAAAGSRRWRDRPLIDLATERLREADDLLGAVRPTSAGQHHHHHLSSCRSMLLEARRCAAIATAKADEDLVAQALRWLREASRHLQAASGALPSFDIVAIEGCCSGPQGRPSQKRKP